MQVARLGVTQEVTGGKATEETNQCRACWKDTFVCSPGRARIAPTVLRGCAVPSTVFSRLIAWDTGLHPALPLS